MHFGSILPRSGQGGAEDPPPDGGGVGLWHWIGVSGVVHGFILIIFLLVPNTPFSRAVSYPVYSVELVGGEKLGASNAAVSVEAPPVSEKKALPAAQVTVPTVKKRVEKKRPSRPPQVKRLKRTTPPRVALAKKPTAPPKEQPKTALERVPEAKPRQPESAQESPTAEAGGKAQAPQEGLRSAVREQLIQAAVDRVKQRAEKGRGGPESPSNGKNAGGGGGDGAAAPGEGGAGGGVLKGIEFLVYRNQMLNLIKERWAWVGKNTELQVTVHFGVLENGDIVGLKIVEKSADPSYDDSVLRAMRKAAPLPPPPINYRSDFMNVELTFRPKDLRG